MSTTTDHHEGLLLPGLDGTNPLGFLAALGTLRLLTRQWRNDGQAGAPPTLWWHEAKGSWRPVIASNAFSSMCGLVRHLCDAIGTLGDDPPKLGSKDELTPGKIELTPEEFHEQAIAVAAKSSSSDRDRLDWLAALATETTTTKKGRCEKTPFDFTSGQQKFLSMAQSIINKTTPKKLHQCLMEEWSYGDTGESLRWDPLDEGRRYALVAVNPSRRSRNPIRTELAANTLAFAALPLFPIIGSGAFGFTAKNETWRWPLWSVSLRVDVVRSLLASGEVQANRPNHTTLDDLGVFEIYESKIVRLGDYYQNFTPAQRIA